jgi:hypothetical protein
MFSRGSLFCSKEVSSKREIKNKKWKMMWSVGFQLAEVRKTNNKKLMDFYI